MVVLKKVLLITICIAVTIGAVSLAYLWQKVDAVQTAVLEVPDNFTYKVERGSNLYSIRSDLQEHVQIDPLGFKIWLRLHPEYTKVKVGLYDIPNDMLFTDFIKKVVAGDEKQFSVTLIEGLTISQWLATLQNAQGLDYDISDLSELYPSLVIHKDSHCANEFKSVEGCLLPNTYFYTDNTKASTILKRAYTDMLNTINALWPTRFFDIPLNSHYETLILASIIEKETSIEEERAEIAGVFTNRLQQNMRLQTDPTVIYGIGADFDGNITRKHLRTPTPYNTYVIKGLPITPIAMPSRASIEAALQPNLTDSLYFVATGNGGHQFSTNLADHNKAVRAYLQQRKKNLENNQ